jgi:hypothetical protein
MGCRVPSAAYDRGARRILGLDDPGFPFRFVAFQGLFGASSHSFALLLSDQRHDADRHVVRVRHVTSDEFDVGLLEQEVSVTTKTVEFGNQKLRTDNLRMVHRRFEFWTVVLPLSALDLRKCLKQPGVSAMTGKELVRT